MANNPVQVVLNDEAFLGAPEPGRAGPDKDFFEGNDSGFVAHKVAMLKRLDSIEETIANWRYGPVAYVRVRMRPEAIAKSYRPSRALLLKDQFPCVGAAAPGELYFRFPGHYIPRLRNRFDEAESRATSRVSGQTGKTYHFVSRARSELGAIETIEIASPANKRSFAVADAVEALLKPSAASGYVVELFEQRPLEIAGDDDVLGLRKSFLSLQDDLSRLGEGLYAALLPSPGGIPSIEVLITDSPARPLLEDLRTIKPNLSSEPAIASVSIDANVERHETTLAVLSEHPLVRRIRFPIQIEAADTATSAASRPYALPARISGGAYPKVGVVDTGVGSILSSWILDRYDFLDPADCDPNHGTLVAGILVGARSENGPEIGRELDGCDIVDIPLMPRGPFLQSYGPRGFEAFLEELESSVAEARARHGVRIFNMSLNITAPVEENLYSVYAARLDEIQDRHGVLIVNSAGNLGGADWRPAWPRTARSALQALAARRSHDTILMPCESVRALAVGALNPPNGSHVEGAPATYTRRGPGLRVGVKPDLAHYGGVGDPAQPTATALASCDLSGNRTETRGTSFAAPLVAKTLAALDIITGQRLDTRTLRAFAVHNAKTPTCLEHRTLKEVARQFVGFGQPSNASAMLETDDHAITLVFESRLTIGERRPAILKFPFAWPASLVKAGTRACSGNVKMTLAYDAPIDQAFGTEFIRVNLDAKLQQRQPANRKDGMPSWRDEITQAFLPKSNGLPPHEKALISHGLKWWPTKRYQGAFNEVGESTEWQLIVESLVRAEATFPAEGIPFSLILTIEDPEKSSPVFNEFRRQLVAGQVDLHDIRTAVRLRPRSGR